MKAVKIKFSPVDIDERKKLDFQSGDTVRVWSKILDEKGKSRLQAFEGIVLARKHGTEIGATFTVRKIASGVGVERIFPLYSPMIDKIVLKKRGNVRRAKLYFLRDRTGKKATKVKGLFVKGASESRDTEVVVKKAGGERPEREEQPAKNKVVKADKPEKIKKIKKGPKKIVRKERQFVR